MFISYFKNKTPISAPYPRVGSFEVRVGVQETAAERVLQLLGN